MMGMEHNQRSNAVGANTSYLPSGDTGREGGGTYTGQATEPTIQDYENFFGPSARDIKTDLQRFKRHGRWHLPDVLQGPNPWLTDRIDGLITDATNSPFTTKILPYRYKEDVDGKIKWNVWSFDEGMASRVPYESAARTLTQSKRSFAGYMVRQGMAIVLEHNFMMTAKGRENFKNQLNQLIGSIQYTNDLDVHMALVLAPSYQKTMQERYYTSDKSPSQLCREYADLFGMMQKNVNALDILIEEGKAILRTWGGPMPDFLLCNSKLTFQMTMSPEKTNYITQGIDGVKRLRQGPDLGNYRGLSIVHTRSFAMETGQHPRDVLRRRVRTAEYYRIPPDPKNKDREFEFYNEERDTFFTLSFLDLLQYAKSNDPRVDDVFHQIKSYRPSMMPGTGGQLGVGALNALGYSMREAGISGQAADFTGKLQTLAEIASNDVLGSKLSAVMCDVFARSSRSWFISGFSGDLVRYIKPNGNDFWDAVETVKTATNLSTMNTAERFVFVTGLPRRLLRDFYQESLRASLSDVLNINNGSSIDRQNDSWHTTYLYFLESIKRQGLPLNMVSPAARNDWCNATIAVDATPNFVNQFLSLGGASGSVNHPLHMLYNRGNPGINANYVRQLTDGHRTVANLYACSLVLTVETLQLLLGTIDGRYVIDVWVENPPNEIWDVLDSVDITRHATLVGMTDAFVTAITQLDPGLINHIVSATDEDLCKMGITSIPMLHTTASHLATKANWAGRDADYQSFLQEIKQVGGQLNMSALRLCPDQHFFMKPPIPEDPGTLGAGSLPEFFKILRRRIFEDPVIKVSNILKPLRSTQQRLDLFDSYPREIQLAQSVSAEGRTVDGMFEGAPALSIDMNKFFTPPDDGAHGAGLQGTSTVDDVEIVVVRPNIEHNMLGIIMGLGGEQLGNTLWGQTELSVYDDSMHGIWGMSYKYHERAIVFNEKNLIRMWDIAYDGYNGGKDDSYVNWRSESSRDTFKEATLNLGKNYRGPSMMVMAFVHDRKSPEFENGFQRNWPSPIVFFDSYDPSASHQPMRESLPIDYDNVQTVDVDQFRVFNNPLYHGAYKEYRNLMPDFRSLHMTRKTAGQSSADAETAVDCLAFQGTMRVKTNGQLLHDIQGSGHHGPDYVGIASVRAGKGQKMAGQAPTLHRLI